LVGGEHALSVDAVPRVAHSREVVDQRRLVYDPGILRCSLATSSLSWAYAHLRHQRIKALFQGWWAGDMIAKSV
jgi:hypothetical protein